MEMRIKKRPSLTKIKKDSSEKQRPMNMTMTTAMFSNKELKQPKLPPLRSNMRKTSVKLLQNKQQKPRMETETTGMGSEMFQSYYQTVDKGWVKPSQFLNDIKQLNLIGGEQLDVQNYQIKLNQKMQKNIAKLELLLSLMQKWISILKKILQYTVSKKSNTSNLIQEVKFWRALSKKFDELQYEFNNEKTENLLLLMKNSIKTKPEYKKSFDQFIKLRDSVIEKTPLLRKLYLSLQQSVSGNIQRFNESSNIATSIEYLKRTLLSFQMIVENNQVIRQRMLVVYDKMNDAMIQKLTAAPVYPRQLANISSIKQKYVIIDKALSFYSNLIGVIQQNNSNSMTQILDRAEYTRNVLVNLLQIMGYFQFLYRKKEVLEFSKLFSLSFEYNIFDQTEKDSWEQYMAKVTESMERKNYEA